MSLLLYSAKIEEIRQLTRDHPEVKTEHIAIRGEFILYRLTW